VTPVYVSITVIAIVVFALWLWVWCRCDHVGTLEWRLDNHKAYLRATRADIDHAFNTISGLEMDVSALSAQVFPPPKPPKIKANTAKAIEQIDGMIDALRAIKKQVKA